MIRFFPVTDLFALGRQSVSQAALVYSCCRQRLCPISLIHNYNRSLLHRDRELDRVEEEHVDRNLSWCLWIVSGKVVVRSQILALSCSTIDARARCRRVAPPGVRLRSVHVHFQLLREYLDNNYYPLGIHIFQFGSSR